MAQRNRLLICAVVGFFALITLLHLASAWAGHSFYRDQHLGTALEYARGQIDLLHPRIVGFNANDVPTLLEFPLWQGLAAAVFKVAGLWFGWANLLSLAIFAAGLVPLHRLATSYLGERGAWWTLLFFLAQPLLIVIAGQASADGLSLACSMWFLYSADRLLRTARLAWLLPATTFGILTATLKLPLFMCVGFTSFFLLLWQAPRSPRHWVLLGTVGLVSGLTFFLWTRYTNHWIELAEYPLESLKVTYGSPAWDWYFGSWSFRLNPVNWAKGGWAALNSIFGSFVLVALAAWSLIFSRNRLAQLWFHGALLTTLVFTHLVLVHRHYFILYSPAVALLAAGAVLRLEELFHSRGWREHLMPVASALLLFLAAVQGLLGIEVVLNYDNYPHRMAAVLRENTNKEEKVVIQGGGWGGEMLILAQRAGLSVLNTKLFEDPRTHDRLLKLGYTKLVLVSESPLLHALQKTNPGSQDRERTSYRKTMLPALEAWPTVLETEDILIKQLPGATP